MNKSPKKNRITNHSWTDSYKLFQKSIKEQDDRLDDTIYNAIMNRKNPEKFSKGILALFPEK